jgi:hypothetical protein
MAVNLRTSLAETREQGQRAGIRPRLPPYLRLRPQLRPALANVVRTVEPLFTGRDVRGADSGYQHGHQGQGGHPTFAHRVLGEPVVNLALFAAS